jgi:hypothetical protein
MIGKAQIFRKCKKPDIEIFISYTLSFHDIHRMSRTLKVRHLLSLVDQTENCGGGIKLAYDGTILFV